MRSKLAALALSLVLSLVVAEFALRAVGPYVWATPFDSAWSWIEFDPFFRWQNRPHSQHNDFEINELGFRAGPIEAEKPEDTLRILMLGDSGTFGIRRQAPGVASTENYPDELAGLLAERPGPRVEVINAGVLGHSVGHGLRILQAKGIGLEPDAVIVRYGFNDHSPSWNPALRATEPELGVLLPWFHASSESGLLNAGLFVTQKMALLHPAPRTVPWTDEVQFEHDLRRMAELSRAHGFTLFFIDYPLRALSRGESAGPTDGMLYQFGVKSLRQLHDLHDRFQAIMRKVAREEGVRVVDTASRCRALGDEACFNEYDLVHPSGNGHRVIAEVVRDALVEEELIDGEVISERRAGADRW